jgi:hypothetical protein
VGHGGVRVQYGFGHYGLEAARVLPEAQQFAQIVVVLKTLLVVPAQECINRAEASC